MTEQQKKEVYFDIYCRRCVHWAKREDESPCDECLNKPWNENSHRPERFKEDD